MTWSREWLRILTLRCEEASMLTSYELEERLSLAERMALRGHLLVCGSCRTLRHQLQFLRTAMRRKHAKLDDQSLVLARLSPEARQRILQTLSKLAGGRSTETTDGRTTETPIEPDEPSDH